MIFKFVDSQSDLDAKLSLSLTLPEGAQPQFSPGELLACEDIVRNYALPVVHEQEYRLPTPLHLQQVLVFTGFSQHENLYAHLPVWPFFTATHALKTMQTGLHSSSLQVKSST